MKSSTLLKQLGCNIKKHRLLLKMSQEQLSFASELDRSYIGGVERGERNISFFNLCKIALALKITPSELIENIKLEMQ
jgi:transcriptional regulator with XRE-family HTH domain